MDLCDLNQIYLYLQKTDGYSPSAETSEDELFQMLISAVTKKIENICDRNFEKSSYIEYQSGFDTNFINLDQFPINNITRIDIMQSWDTVGSEVTIYDIDYDSGAIYSQTVFPTGERNIKIEYNAGYDFDSIPEDLNLICVKEVVNEKNRTKRRGNFKSEKLGAYSYTVSDIAEQNLKNNLLRANYISL